jgi:hypothetical protein
MSQLAARLITVPPMRLLLTVLAAVAMLFAVAFDQGQLAQLVQAAAGDSTVHELFHDARHMLGFPCH